MSRLKCLGPWAKEMNVTQARPMSFVYRLGQKLWARFDLLSNWTSGLRGLVPLPFIDLFELQAEYHVVPSISNSVSWVLVANHFPNLPFYRKLLNTSKL